MRIKELSGEMEVFHTLGNSYKFVRTQTICLESAHFTIYANYTFFLMWGWEKGWKVVVNSGEFPSETKYIIMFYH